MPALRRISRDFLAASGPTLGASAISRDFLAAGGPALGAGPRRHALLRHGGGKIRGLKAHFISLTLGTTNSTLLPRATDS